MWLGCGVGALMIAESKGRSGPGWFMAGLLLGPLALLIVGFMAGGAPATEPNPGSETVLYSDGKIRVTNQGVLIEDDTFGIKTLQPVVVTSNWPNGWELKLHNWTGKRIFTITSDNEDRIK